MTRAPLSRSNGQRSTCRGWGILWRPPAQLVTRQEVEELITWLDHETSDKWWIAKVKVSKEHWLHRFLQLINFSTSKISCRMQTSKLYGRQNMPRPANGDLWFSRSEDMAGSLTSHSTQYRSFWRRQIWLIFGHVLSGLVTLTFELVRNVFLPVLTLLRLLFVGIWADAPAHTDELHDVMTSFDWGHHACRSILDLGSGTAAHGTDGRTDSRQPSVHTPPGGA